MTEDTIYGIFDLGGTLNSAIPSFEFREGQLNMALDVLKCYENNAIGAIEAGTGIGKSFAYLVPALLYAFEDESDRTIIATSTINLQKQLMEKDLPTLFKALGRECKVALAVGRNNYLCLRRLAELVASNALYATDGVSEVSKLNRFANETETGLKSDFPGKLDLQVWNTICSDSDFCMGGKCPYSGECFYFKAKKKLAQASIIICNHHLLFVDSATRLESNIEYSEDAILPPFDRLVIDEAHNIERHATDLFTMEYSSYALKRQIDYIHSSSPRSTVGRMLDDLNPFCSDKELYDKIVNQILLVKNDADTLNLSALHILEYNNLAHVLATRMNAKRILDSVVDSSQILQNNTRHLCELLTKFASKLNSAEDMTFKVDELEVHISRIQSILENLCTFMDFDNWNDDIHYLDVEKHGGTKYVTMNIAPLDVSATLQEALFRKVGSIVCTSATLDLNDGFGYWGSSIGLPLDSKKYLRKVYSSQFDYKSRLMLLTPYDTPVFSKDNEEEYASFICETVYRAICASGGGALVLFTSIRLMDYVHDMLKPRLDVMEITCLKQGDMDRYSLLEKFKSDTDSVLFATDSFWEGVDAPGNTLRLVIITKLPFKMPDDPIYKARYAKLEQEGKSGFYCLSLPDATMKLKQGYGRLMRHTTDKGIVLILDSRLVSKGYGAIMLHALPESYHPETELSTIEQKIESFLY